MRKVEIEKMEADIRKLTKRRDSDDSDDEPAKKKAKKSYLEEELAKYAKGRGLNKKGKDGKRRDEGDVLATLNSFRGRLKGGVFGDHGPDDGGGGGGGGGGGDGAEEEVGEKKLGEEDAGVEVDDDRGFMSHALHFPKDDGEESRKAERDYEVIDPRQRGARAKEEERERKRVIKARGGGGGGRYRR
jgi:peptidyl-prolyl cis-trans isomerase SDCCAG10